jgi:hypothetical protein
VTSLHRLVDAWSRRTLRERRLAIAVAALGCALMGALAWRAAAGLLDRLDREIGQLSNEILNATHEQALRARVEARFAQVANQHSSAWTESEIRDRLRQEIYRLSNLEPPALDAAGIPVNTNNESGYLVEVPELGAGRLIDGGEGYREYQIEFSIPPVPILDLTAYLERLLESPQALRIDRIDLRRDPGRTEFASDLVITRTVVDNPGGLGAASRSMTLNPDEWRCDGCTALLEERPGAETVLVLKGGSGGGKAALAQTLPAPGLVDVALDLASTSTGQLGVAVDGGPLPGTGETALKDDGRFYRYRFQLALPAASGGRVAASLPVLTWTRPDSALRIRRIEVTPAGGGDHGP